MWYEVFKEIEQAIFFEKKIKKCSSNKKRALAEGDGNMLQILAEYRNTSYFKYKPSGLDFSLY
ncbi:CRISPR-associated protein Cas1 [Croceitalea dokdonensis DOKDO 023]|uniref:CRISPR-associated protein Cas1 n=1 Tax=Croceitalea dokdonensis DOKDO 023 TaxID=1300341 RepID=A0A0P7AHP5_9FLAO|nr:CRISPR-associated protein Cas1 [Croceitalea dokdonensis DOKDO 023]